MKPFKNKITIKCSDLNEAEVLYKKLKSFYDWEIQKRIRLKWDWKNLCFLYTFTITQKK